jgi:hypothetical protein
MLATQCTVSINAIRSTFKPWSACLLDCLVRTEGIVERDQIDLAAVDPTPSLIICKSATCGRRRSRKNLPPRQLHTHNRSSLSAPDHDDFIPKES